MSHFLQQLDEATLQKIDDQMKLKELEKRTDQVIDRENACDELEAHLKSENKLFDLIMSGRAIVLDTALDPDPYGYHNIPLATRLQCMGWK